MDYKYDRFLGITRNSHFQMAIYIAIILLMTNLNAIIDLLLHPEIPYFDDEHLIVGGVTGLICSILFVLIIAYEKKLHRSKERHRTILQTAMDGFWLADMQGHLLEVNETYCRMSGYGEQELLAMCITDMEAAERNDDTAAHIQKIIEQGQDRFETRHRRKDGSILDVETSVQYRANEGGQFVVFLHDITDRKRAEVALKESEEKYRSLFDNAVEGVFQTTPEGRFLSANPAQAKLFGYDSPQELMERITNIGRQHYVNPEDLETYRNTLERDGVIKGFETQLINKDGNSVWASISARAVRNDEGVIIYYEGTSEDITARKQAEKEKQTLEERLQRSEKMESLGTLAGGVAHDLNNVLGIVVGYAELTLMNADESSSIRPHLVNIMNGGMKAAAIVDDLLTLARRGVSGRDVLNLNKIIADFQQSPEFEKLYSYHPSVKIKTDLEADLSNISGSSVHLAKSLYNLVSNASEAMTKGGVVTIKTSNQYLDKPIQGYDHIQEGDYVVLSVSDTGEGIPAADLKRIFEPFYTKKVMRRSGTGLGLAVVWGTVKDHNGYINVQSEKGKGSTFTLYFPVTREDITAEAVAIAISEYMGNGESILVVDDVKEQRDLAFSMLGMLNYNVSSVSSGKKAVAYVKEHEVDLMVLDMIMDPGMDGLDTYRSVLVTYPKQKAIIVSGFSESDRVKTAKDLGAGAYVRKPYVIEKLGLAVRKELNRK